MSLRLIDITKGKRLSVLGVKLKAPAIWAETVTPNHTETALTEAERAYLEIMEGYPHIERLIEALDMESISGAYQIIKRLKTASSEPQEPNFIALSSSIIDGGTIYTKEEIIARIKQATNVNESKAERGFISMLQAGAIATTLGDRYYLPGTDIF